MKIRNFIKSVTKLGYECRVDKTKIEIYRLYGKDLRNFTKLATINLAATNHFSMSLDPTSANDGLGELIVQFGLSSLRERGRLEMYSYHDGNRIGVLSNALKI